jgi:ribonuclease III
MDDSVRNVLVHVMTANDIPLNAKTGEFIRLFNRDIGSGDSPCWQVTTDAWQRYEFLGDRILNLIAAEYLYLRSPQEREGEMTKKMGVVSNESLAGIIEQNGIDVDRVIPGAMSQQQTYGDAVKGGALEALIGALYSAAGFEATRTFILSFLAGEIDRYDPATNYIGQLQETFQRDGLPVPVYSEIIEKRTGPAHAPMFVYRVSDTGGRLGEGSGKSVMEARQQAAKMALENKKPIVCKNTPATEKRPDP